MACEICQKPYVFTNDDSFDVDVKPHLCTTCGKSFSLKIQLKRHLLSHVAGAPYICRNCENNTENRDTKSYNLRLTKKPDHYCDVCNKSFCTKRLLLIHSQEHTEHIDENYSCDKCEERFVNAFDLKKHSLIHKSKKSTNKVVKDSKVELYKCNTCDKSFASARHLEKHFVSHNKKHVCDVCNKSFVYPKALHNHQVNGKCKNNSSQSDCIINSNESNVKSSNSDASQLESPSSSVSEFKNQFALDSSNSVTKSMSNSPLNISVASKIQNDANLDESGTVDRKHVCDICGKSFARKSSLEGHVIIHISESFDSAGEEDVSDEDQVWNTTVETKGVGIEDYEGYPKKIKLSKVKVNKTLECSNCDFICNSKRNLKEHMLEHDRVSSVEDIQEEHDKISLVEDIQEEHDNVSSVEDIQENDKPCEDTFNSNEGLNEQIDTKDEKEEKKDKEQKIYTCQICNKVYHRKKRLKKHLLLHVEGGIAEHHSTASDDSDVSISSKGRRKRRKNFACGVCGKRFAGETCLRKHSMKHTDEEREHGCELKTSRKKKPVKVLICEYCNEEFTGKKLAFERHRQMHTPEVCGICDERFVDRPSLREHCRIHIGTEEGRRFIECSQKALDAKNGVLPPEPKVEYIYLVFR
ncbi:zinc finger protein 836-like [Stegodyphus dumicola]|uniref:zinc finger protein 836-like n=1 Tax=Stegodyphus dumicola TaxID=202533 RepID=UPI0015A8DDA8|nr:zinc finger protein 836-like [Stegodyphus dumicola]